MSVSGSESGKESIRSAASGTLLIRALGILLLFASTTLTAKLLGPAEYGTYSAGLSLAMLLATLAPLGTDRILIRNLSIRPSLDDAAPEVRLTHRCALLVSGALLAGCLVIALLCHQLRLYPWRETTLLAALMFGPLTLTYLRQWIAIPLIGTRRAVMPEQILIPGCSLILLPGLFLLMPSALTARTAALLFSGLTITVWGLTSCHGVLKPLYSAAIASNILPNGALRDRFHAGLPFVFVAVGGILCQRSIPLAVAAGCSFADTAQLSYAMLIAGLPSIPLGLLNMSLIPGFARLYHSGRNDESRVLARNAATLIFLISTALCAAIMVASPLFVRILGIQWQTVTVLLPALLLATIVDCLTGPTIPVMQTSGMERAYSRLLFAYIPLQLVLLYVFSRMAAVEGAALAYLLGRCIWNILVVVMIYRQRSLIMLPSLQSLRDGLAMIQKRFLSAAGTAGSGQPMPLAESGGRHIV
ncbi:MAG: lipopolysaccharide biosynthesis protein [Planctomycetia bacterium]